MNDYIPAPFPPDAIGLPYSHYRAYQWDATTKAAWPVSRFTGLCLPTGAGKSAIAMGAVLMHGNGRSVILTSTKAQQDQILREFGHIRGLVDIRGHNAYECKPRRTASGRWMCDEDIDHCPYQQARERAKLAKIILTNYSFWVSDWLHNQGKSVFVGVSFAVMDEAHLTFNDVTNALTMDFARWFLQRHVDLWPENVEGMDADRWLGHFRLVRPRLTAAQDQAKHEVDRLRLQGLKKDNGAMKDAVAELAHLRAVSASIDRLKAMDVSNANWEATVRLGGQRDQVEFSPVWLHELADEYLYKGLRHVVFTSATLTPKTLAELGVPESELAFFSYPSTFPPERRPFYYIPTVHLNARSTSADMNAVVARVDEIVGMRQDRKGLVHSVSYERGMTIKTRSMYGAIMQTHWPGKAGDAVEAFKASPPPSVLVSPAIEHGFDFPAEQAEFVVLPKLMLRSKSESALIKRRADEDGDYIPNLAMQDVVQAVGRINRAIEDVGEAFMLDKNWGWFWPKHRNLAPEWFEPQWAERVPPPPEKVRVGVA